VDGVVCASVLDGIGDPQLTYENQCRMEERGVRPLPCFHYGEDERYLEYYLDHYEYITLGGMVPIAKPQVLAWLDRLWERYLTRGGHAKLKVHGFGLNAFKLMKRYPWFSVDASSWVQQAANGKIILPWGEGILYFPISAESTFARKHNQHYTTIPPEARERIESEITRRGFTLLDLQTKYLSRWIFNCAMFREIQDQLFNKEVYFANEAFSLF
jgi:hypothetical protein